MARSGRAKTAKRGTSILLRAGIKVRFHTKKAKHTKDAKLSLRSGCAEIVTAPPLLTLVAAPSAMPRPADPAAATAPDRGAHRPPYPPFRTPPAEYPAVRDSSPPDAGTHNPETR